MLALRSVAVRVLLLALCAGLCGCFEIEQHFVLNPDGSGKVRVDAKFQSVALMPTGEAPKSVTEQMQEAIVSTLEKSTGVEAWSDLSYQLNDTGLIEFHGTAYFTDLSKVRLMLGGAKLNFSHSFKPSGEDRVLMMDQEMETKPKPSSPEKPFTEMTADEQRQEMLDQRVAYQQSKAGLEAFLGNLKVTSFFQLPGQVASASNFQQTDGGLRTQMVGRKMIDLIRETVLDDQKLRELLTTGAKIGQNEPVITSYFNKFLFGEFGPVEAVVSAPLTVQFDYQAEVAEARPYQAKLLSTLQKPTAAQPVPPVAIEEKEPLEGMYLAGVRYEQLTPLAPKVYGYSSPGMNLAFVGKLPKGVIAIDQGEIDKAVTDTGVSLLPEDDNKQGFHPYLKPDQEGAYTFSIDLALPPENATKIAEFSGWLEYATSDGTRTVDLEITRFKEGTEGTSFGAIIGELGPEEDSGNPLKIKLALPHLAVKEIRFFDSKGKALEAGKSTTSYTENECTIEYISKSAWPEEGRIEVELYENIQRHKATISFRDLPLILHASPAEPATETTAE